MEHDLQNKASQSGRKPADTARFAIPSLRTVFGETDSAVSGIFICNEGFLLAEPASSKAELDRVREWLAMLNRALFPAFIGGCGFDLGRKPLASGPVEAASLRACVRDLASTFEEIDGYEELSGYRTSTLTFEWRAGDGSPGDCACGATSGPGEMAGAVSPAATDAATRMLRRQAGVASTLARSFRTVMPASGITQLFILVPHPRVVGEMRPGLKTVYN